MNEGMICQSCKKYSYQLGDKYCEWCGNRVIPRNANPKIWIAKRAQSRSPGRIIALIYVITILLLAAAIFFGVSGVRHLLAGRQNAVTEDSVGTGTVTEDGVGTGTVTEDSAGTGTVTGDGVGTGTVTEDSVGTGTVTGDGVGIGTVTDEGSGLKTATDEGAGTDGGTTEETQIIYIE